MVADGGSSDATATIAAGAGATVAAAAQGPRPAIGGRRQSGARQLALVPAADTVLEPFWSTTITTFMALRSNLLRAGYFRLALDDDAPAARRIERRPIGAREPWACLMAIKAC